LAPAHLQNNTRATITKNTVKGYVVLIGTLQSVTFALPRTSMGARRPRDVAPPRTGSARRNCCQTSAAVAEMAAVAATMKEITRVWNISTSTHVSRRIHTR
jgi:hypothetical protein